MDLNTATREELIAHGSEIGVTLDKRMSLETMVSRISAFEQREQEEESGNARETVRIIIAKSADAGGDQPIPIPHNGVHNVLARGEPIDCPVHLLEHLDHAIATVITQDDNGNTVERQVQRYPYQRV